MNYADLCAGLSNETLTLAYAALGNGGRPSAAVDADALAAAIRAELVARNRR